MEIRLRSTGAVMTEGEFRSLHPETSFPYQLTEELINSLEADLVFEGPQAQPTRYQYAYRDGVEQVDGRWFTKWSVADMDEDARAAKDAEQARSVRADRNKKLQETDWSQGKDIPDSISEPWAVYRQELRDLTKQPGFPWEVVWPTKPE